MRDVIYTCIKPLVRGTLAVLRGLLTTPGEHYQAAPERERVARLRTEGFSIAVPIPEQIDQFTDKVGKSNKVCHLYVVSERKCIEHN